MINLDPQTIGKIVNEIERALDNDRRTVDSIIAVNKEYKTYEDMQNSGNLLKVYADACDVLVTVCNLKAGVSESLMDLRKLRRAVVDPSSGMMPTFVKTYKVRIDNLIEEVAEFRDALDSVKQGMEARVRYYNSTAYMGYERAVGAKC